MNAKWMTVVPGKVDRRLPMACQTSNAIDLLKRCAEICEPFGLVMVLEPLNHWANRPGLFLHTIPQASRICRAVDSPSCKILFDIYQQPTTETGQSFKMARGGWGRSGAFGAQPPEHFRSGGSKTRPQPPVEGRLIPLIDKAWDEIAYFQIGDNPGRKEPGTGEINFCDIFGRIQQRGYGGIWGMDHGNSMPGEEGEQAVIDAYVTHDHF